MKLSPADVEAHRIANINSARQALANRPDLSQLVGYDTFTGVTCRVRACAWKDSIGPIDKEDTLRIAERLQKCGLNVSVQIVEQALYLEAMDNQFDSLQQDMERLIWDRVERLNRWLSTYMGAPSSEYTRFIGRKFLIAAVARAYQPGCKVDTVLILRGAQGLGKSTAIELLAGTDRFTDQLPDLHSKDACMQLQGKHFVEISELASLKRARNSDMKSFISRAVDTYRAPYATHTTRQPRRVVFVGTTNDDEYHSDPTGARRFWDCECTNIDLEALRRDRAQLWAEAVHAYKNGAIWHLTPEEEILAAAEQAKHYIEDPWADLIDEFVWQNEKVITKDVLEKGLRLFPGQIDQRARKRVNNHLRRWGWIESKSGSNRVWHRPMVLPVHVRLAPKGTSWSAMQAHLKATSEADSEAA